MTLFALPCSHTKSMVRSPSAGSGLCWARVEAHGSRMMLLALRNAAANRSEYIIESSRSVGVVDHRRLLLPELVEGRLETGSELLDWSRSPVMQEIDRRLSRRHVIVNRHDIQTVSSKRLQDRCNFLGQHGQVAR